MRRTHLELLAGLAEDPDSETCSVAASWPASRCGAAASPGSWSGPRIGTASPADLDEVAATVVRAAHGLRLPALVCEVERDLRVLVSAPASADADDLVDRVAARVLPTTTSYSLRGGWWTSGRGSRGR